MMDFVYIDLSEYTSRRARFRLVGACLDFYEKLAEKSGVSPTKALAQSLGVSQRTVQRWAQGGIQSCNPNAEELIHLAITITPRKAAQILLEDLDTHQTTLKALLEAHPEALGSVTQANTPTPMVGETEEKALEEEAVAR